MQWKAMAAVLAFTLACAGCARRQQVSADPLGAAPTDFAIELTILTGLDTPTSSEAHLRQSRYVLFADGSLCQGDDPQRAHGPDWLPPLTRVLTRRQVAETWSLAQQLGFTDPANAQRGAVNFKLMAPPKDGVAYLAAISGWGERWTFVRAGALGEPDPAMVQLSRDLARLAWATDQLPAAISLAPKRYDFGPDPYARFRQPGGAPAADIAEAKSGGGQN